PEADAPPPTRDAAGPRISVLLAVKDPDPSWLAAAFASLASQTYRNVQLCLADDGCRDPEVRELLALAARQPDTILVESDAPGGISCALNAALRVAEGEWIAVLDHDDTLAPHALEWIAHTAREVPDADLIYSDEDKLDLEGNRTEPFFKPDWSPHYLLSINYLCHLTALRRELVEELGGFRSAYDGAQDYDLFLRAAPRARRIEHVPRLLYHWRKVPGSTAASLRNKGYAREAGRAALADALPAWGLSDARVELVPHSAGYRVRPALGDERVCVIVPTRDRLDLLEPCLESVARTRYAARELLVVDNGSREGATLAYLEREEQAGRLRRLRIDLPFNFGHLVNQAVATTDAEWVLALNNDVVLHDPEWLEAMLEAAHLPGVGVVGAQLRYPDGTLQHAGVVLGDGGPAAHAFLGLRPGEPTPGGRLGLISNFSAVTGACLLIRRSLYLELGGLDEEGLANSYGDVDLCLRVLERGLYCVCTPFAVGTHHEGASRGRRANEPAEDVLWERHPERIARDPYASPHRSLVHGG
ncbi:MAG TPA: hypothetical protein DEA08_25500, partial [Planctomycetes bacterium]|nr:hypothetical protein [Planctomycetota bacterium]